MSSDAGSLPTSGSIVRDRSCDPSRSVEADAADDGDNFYLFDEADLAGTSRSTNQLGCYYSAEKAKGSSTNSTTTTKPVEVTDVDAEELPPLNPASRRTRSCAAVL
eukprot:IDg20578t1